MNDPTTRCIDCRFWIPDQVNPPSDLENEDWYGRCHRHAPTPRGSTDLIDERAMWWPMTAHYDWCGEFKPRKKPASPDLVEGTTSEVDLARLKPWRRFCQMFSTPNVAYRLGDAWSGDYKLASGASMFEWFESLGWAKFTELLSGGPGDLCSRDWIKSRLLRVHHIGHSTAAKVIDYMASCGWPFRD